MMNFEDLPAHVQEQIAADMHHEEPGQREAVEQELARLQRAAADAEADQQLDDALTQLAEAGDEQERFDKATAEAADVPLDFVQLYNKIEAEVSAAVDGKQPQHVTSAAVNPARQSLLCSRSRAAHHRPERDE
ncbi:hypothetical protein SEA_SHADE_44 [Arthrobacter phage Shade]|uniref:Uncharacterized protein n=1 Tax=Arthrobacter phage Shade TaxID=2024283 RepID=A0A222Z8B1_9CAUD|nr:hypothetical protein FDI42_gp44 [Arthrobacter phage Shade]ASR80749.1 hypothetical protein SEA_SHADE_44 [Arthrobacter phage Shade]